MKSTKPFRLIASWSLVAGLLILSGCGNAESDWKRAQAKHTPEAYREYAAEYPSANRVIRAVGDFTGHSIMLGDDGRLFTGMFGGEPPGFEIRSASVPGFAYRMSVNDAAAAGLVKDGTLELAANYTYTDGEMLVLVTRSGDAEVHTLVYFKCVQSASAPDDGSVIASKEKTLEVSLLHEPSRDSWR